MIKVKNRKVISNISTQSLKANRLRNIFAITAIALTALMFTAIFTVGGSILKSVQQGTMRQVGTSAHAGFKYLTQEQYATLKADPKVRDISYDIFIGIAENQQLRKLQTEIRWTEEKSAQWSFSAPTTGALPKEGMEIATSSAVLDALGVPHELGAAVPLEFTANGKHYREVFTLCGYWQSDPVAAANQAFLSRQYCDSVAPVHTTALNKKGITDLSAQAGSLNASLWFATAWNIQGQVQALMARCGFDPREVNSGVNWAYASSSVDPETVLLIALLLALVLFSGYLIIYNIFSLSVTRDIQFYGLLKTLGTTGRQLKKIVRRQALLLCAAGIPMGLLLGWLCGWLITPAVIRSTNLGEVYAISISPFIFAGAGLFALFTVYLSCLRPSRLAAKVSPIEAVRFSGVENTWQKAHKKSARVTPLSMAFSNLRRGRKKALIVILSLSLAMVLVNSVYTIIKGFDMEKYLSERVVSDFLISDATIRNSFSSTPVLDGVTPEVLKKIQSLKGLEAMGSVYMKEATHLLSDTAYKNTLEIISRYQDSMPRPYAEENIRMAKDEHKLITHIYGMDDFAASKLAIKKGRLDMAKFKSGSYVIVSSFESEGDGCYYQVGDRVTIDFGNGRSKEYEVLAIGMPPYALGPGHSHYLDICFTLPSAEYAAQIGETQPLCTAFDVAEAHTAQVQSWIENYCKNVDPKLDYESRATYINEFENMERMYLVVGGVLSAILSLIGVLNFLNSFATSVLARRRELAMLQAIGMTNRQLRQMLTGEGLIYAAITLLLTITAGSVLSYVLVRLISSQSWFFTWHFTLVPIFCCLPFLLLISCFIPSLSYRLASRHSIVERLRETE